MDACNPFTGCLTDTPRIPVPHPGHKLQGLGIQLLRPPVGSLSVLRNTIYNQVTIEQEVVWVKREVIDYQTVLQAP